MKKYILTLIMVASVAIGFCQNIKNKNTFQMTNQIKRLELTELNQDLDSIRVLYDDVATILYPDMTPIAGIDAIISLYEFIWNRPALQSAAYLSDSVAKKNGIITDIGIYIFKEAEKDIDTLRYRAEFIPSNGTYKIKEIAFGYKATIQSEQPRLLKPTGEYRVGVATYSKDDNKIKNARMVAFQIWYPANPQNKELENYQTVEIAKTSADFIGLPYFALSYATQFESNCYKNAPVVKNTKFPVLLYNHGYGGFTSVYQTVFEELASQGYIVVSIGHENESSLLISDDGAIIATDPRNEFYSSRATELNGNEINSLQNIILNSDDLEENTYAYKQLVKKSPLHNESTRLWASDTRQVIQILKKIDKKDGKLKDAFDFDKIGLFGHSVGGATAGQLAINNHEIKAGINLDGFQFGELVNSKLKIPFMFVSSNETGNSYLRANHFISESENDCYQVVINGFSHESFSDLEFIFFNNERAIQLQRDLISSFFNKYLKNHTGDFENIGSEYSEILIKNKKGIKN